MSDLVLIVDADLQTVAWLKARLESEGLHTDSAIRGEQAWQKIEATVPAVVVLDPRLPDMNGLDLIYRVRQDPRFINTAVFVLSARVQPNEINQSINAGASDYIIKRPGADVELIAKIQAQLAQPPKTILDATLAKRGRIFSFCSAKGGTGTTSVCVNTACALAKLAPAGTEIVVVDMVLPIGTIGFSLGFESPNTLAQLSNEVGDKIARAQIPKYVSQPLRWGFRVMTAARNPHEAGTLNVAHVPSLFFNLQSMYDYILVDFGRTLSRISLPILEMSTGIVVIVTPDISTVRATRIIVDHLQSQNIAPDRLILVNNRTVGRVWTTTEDIEQEVKLPLAVTVPYEVEYMTMAINAAIPFMEKFPNNAATMSFIDLARILIDRFKRKS